MGKLTVVTSTVPGWQDRTQNSKPRFNREFIGVDSDYAFGLTP